ncbi:heparinase II/III family protein [Enterococcus sp. LJL99]
MNKIETMICLKKKNSKFIDFNLYNKILEKIQISKKFHIKNSLSGEFTSHINSIEKMKNEIDYEVLSWCCNKYMDFYFDILGSGWKYIGHFSNDNIESIDWDRDITTGLYISEKNLQNKIDIKNIWELSRQYYLPQLAIFKHFQHDSRYRAEIDERIYDDIVSLNKLEEDHPCWTSPMDVSIRCCNQLIAIDISRIDKTSLFYDIQKNKELYKYFDRCYKFILNNLELNYLNGKNGNHYLSNLIGLLFLRTYFGLENDSTVSEFLFSEFFIELDQQLSSDGTIYECSTAYHRLSLELILFGISIATKHNHKNLKKIEMDKIFSAIDFLKKCSINSRLIQIGDNDSGHLFNINLKGEFKKGILLAKENINYEKYDGSEVFFEEDYLDTTEITQIFSSNGNTFFSCLLEQVSDGKIFSLKKMKNTIATGNHFSQKKFEFDPKLLIYKKSKTIKMSFENLKDINYWEDFGLIRVENNYDDILFLRVPFNYNNKLLAHCHDDIFGLEYIENGKHFYQDKGSFNYTPLTQIRNYFRSYKVHFKPVFKESLIDFLDVFSVKSHLDNFFVDINIKNNEEKKIIISAKWKKTVFLREVYFYKTKVLIKDSSNLSFFYNEPDGELKSEGYGKINKDIGVNIYND